MAEILLNRLLHPEAFDFTGVATVVMDEFHSFADPERGVVWELSLAMLPKHVRVLLLSATVGNAAEFIVWLNRSLDRKVQLIQSTERKVPLTYVWVGDQLLNEELEIMADGDDAKRRTPGPRLLFQPRRMLVGRRAAQGQKPAGRRAAEAARRTARQARLVEGGRAETQANPAARASASITRAFCPDTAAWSRSCSSASFFRSASARKRWPRGSTCRPDRSC